MPTEEIGPNITSFDSIDEMFAYVEAGRARLDARVRPWQTKIKPGDFLLRLVPGGSYGVATPQLALYAEVLPDDPGDEIDRSPGSPQEHFRFVRAASVLEPRGELGDWHVSTVTQVLKPHQYQMAKRNDWPTDPGGLIAILTAPVGDPGGGG
jgi:hypothetical protein